MAKKAKVLDECRISVMGKGGKPTQLTPDEARTIQSLNSKDEASARAKAKAAEAKAKAKAARDASKGKK